MAKEIMFKGKTEKDFKNMNLNEYILITNSKQRRSLKRGFTEEQKRFLEKIKKSGAVAFKIEGRNREPEYVDTVVRVYRKALDKRLSKKEMQNSIKELEKAYNKGFSSGFYIKSPTNDDFSKAENSSASRSKEFIGKIIHYYPRINVGLLKLNTGILKTGDEIITKNTSNSKRRKFKKK
jgi:putative protease